MLLATVSASQVQCLTSLLIASKSRRLKAEVARLVETARDPTRVLVVWAAINFFNIGLHSKIKAITQWNAIEVLEFLLSVQWESPRRNLDELANALDSARAAKALREGKTPHLHTSVHVGRWPDGVD